MPLVPGQAFLSTMKNQMIQMVLQQPPSSSLTLLIYNPNRGVRPGNIGSYGHLGELTVSGKFIKKTITLSVPHPDLASFTEEFYSVLMWCWLLIQRDIFVLNSINVLFISAINGLIFIKNTHLFIFFVSKLLL